MHKMGFTVSFESEEFLEMTAWLEAQLPGNVDKRMTWEIGNKAREVKTAYQCRQLARTLGYSVFYRVMRYTGNEWYAQLQILHGLREPESDSQEIGIEDHLLAIQFRLIFSQYLTSEPYIRFLSRT